MDQKLFITFAAFAFLLGALYLLFLILEPFLPAIGWGVVIAIATYPLYLRLLTRTKNRPNLTSALMTAVVFLVVVVPSVGVAAMLVTELIEAQRLLAEAAAQSSPLGLQTLLDHPIAGPWVRRVLDLAATANIDVKAATVQAGKNVVSFLLASLGTVIKNLFQFLFQMLLIVLVLFFLYRDGARLEQAFWSMLPMSKKRMTLVRKTSVDVVGAVVIGVLVTALVQGMLGALGYWFTGLGSPVLLGALTFISAFIPVVGTALVWLPAVIYLLVTGEIGYGLVLLVWGGVVISGVDSLLRPFLISNRTGLPLSLMLLGALGGLIAFGLFGLVIGPLVLAIFLVWHQARTIEAAQARKGESG